MSKFSPSKFPPSEKIRLKEQRQAERAEQLRKKRCEYIRRWREKQRKLAEKKRRASRPLTGERRLRRDLKEQLRAGFSFDEMARMLSCRFRSEVSLTELAALLTKFGLVGDA